MVTQTLAPETGSIAWLHDFTEATAISRTERKPIIVDVYQDNCGGCDKLDDETFAHPDVIDALGSRFVAVKLHLFQDREFTRTNQVFWTPTILFADRSGKVRYTSPNYLPVPEFLDLLDIGEAMVAMRWKGYEQAIGLLTSLRDRSPDGPLTAEAIYWRGIAAYFRDGRSSRSANAEWSELLERFPDSIWAKRIP
jgi:thioredoxin-related protein